MDEVGRLIEKNNELIREVERLKRGDFTPEEKAALRGRGLFIGVMGETVVRPVYPVGEED